MQRPCSGGDGLSVVLKWSSWKKGYPCFFPSLSLLSPSPSPSPPPNSLFLPLFKLAGAGSAAKYQEAGGVAQWAEHLLSRHRPRLGPPAPPKPGMVVHACNPTPWEVEAEDKSEIIGEAELKAGPFLFETLFSKFKSQASPGASIYSSRHPHYKQTLGKATLPLGRLRITPGAQPGLC